MISLRIDIMIYGLSLPQFLDNGLVPTTIMLD